MSSLGPPHTLIRPWVCCCTCWIGGNSASTQHGLYTICYVCTRRYRKPVSVHRWTNRWRGTAQSTRSWLRTRTWTSSQTKSVLWCILHTYFISTPSTPAVSSCCCLKGLAPYWSNPPFLIFDIRALWRSGLSARAPECQKLKTVG